MAAKKRRTKNADLGEYHRKRDFGRTAEPRGGGVDASETGRLFVVQKHAATSLHYDFRLELDGVLKSWAVPKGPSLDPRKKPLAVHTEDHPIEYGSFEGVIPPDEYGGGTVMLWDSGAWEAIGDPVEAYERGDFKFRLHGEKLRGEWVLARMKGDAGAGGRNWLLIKKKDDAARPTEAFNVLAELPFSVASGRTMEAIAADPEAVWTDGRAQKPERAGDASATPAAVPAAIPPGTPLPDPASLPGARVASMPAKLAPQLCATADRAPAGDDWLHEVKLDGYRLMAWVKDGNVRLLTRNGHDWTERFATVARAVGRLPVESVILDGEVVVLDKDGVPDFGALQGALRGPDRAPFTYFVFDVPYALGHDLAKVPLLARKTFLKAVIEASPMIAPTVQVSEHIVGNGPAAHAHAREYGLEGIISKRLDARYVSRRAETWLKVKCRLHQSLLVGGYTTPAGGRSGFGALLIGFHDDGGKLVYAGRVGSGFTDHMLESLAADLKRRARKTSPFVNPELDPDAKTAHWVRADMVVEVEFTSWTKDGLLRQASFRGVREDVEPGDVVREPVPRPPIAEATPRTPRETSTPRRARGVVRAPMSPEDAVVAGVRISNPGRAVYPEARITKREVAEYYAAIAEWILPYVTRRPLSVVRCPLGLAGDAFYQKHVGDGFPKSIRGTPQSDQGVADPFLVIDDLDGLLALVQMGVLEIHTWGCRVDELERPDHLVVDLDPGPGIVWEHVIASADFVRRHLENLGLRSFVKTTGGNGLHVVVPITRRTTWDDAKAFCHGVAKDLVRLAPKNFVATTSKDFRKNRIFIDYLRNVRGATAVGPYSTRARPGARVSTPLAWDELAVDRPPSGFTVRTVPDRLAGLREDPWGDFGSVRSSITKSMLKAVGVIRT